MIVGGSGGHGFLLSADGSTYTIFDVPGAVGTSPWGINTDGQIVGSYADSSFVAHGFLLSADGSSYTNIDDPDGVITLAYRINDAGQIVGYYQDSSGQNHGFIATPI